MSSLRKDVLKKGKMASLEGIEEHDLVGELLHTPANRPMNPRLNAKYAPVGWDTCFDACQDISIPNTKDVFRVYSTGLLADNLSTRPPVFVMHHGAGHSGLSFGLAARHIQDIAKGECAVIAFDCRGHGDSRTDDPTNLSLERLSDDLVAVITELFRGRDHDIILVGHSMGGAIVVDVARRKRIPGILGVAVLDVVEGSALESLSSMPRILSTRPNEFNSVEEAIQWCVKHDMLHNAASAKVSVPSMFKHNENGRYTWRTNLSASKTHWGAWFTGLSEKFLATPAAKLLILAGTDRLDQPLMIGQMQGKFQLQIFPEAGHFLQEDEPEKTARCLVDFWKRNQRLVLPPKVPVPDKATVAD